VTKVCGVGPRVLRRVATWVCYPPLPGRGAANDAGRVLVVHGSQIFRSWRATPTIFRPFIVGREVAKKRGRSGDGYTLARGAANGFAVSLARPFRRRGPGVEPDCGPFFQRLLTSLFPIE
jgi:hypothetical protein